MNTIRVMTYNIQRCQGGDGLTSLDGVLRVIEEGAPDTVALQETDPELLEQLGRRLGMRTFGQPAPGGPAFLSYLPLRGVLEHPLGLGGSCLRADADFGGKRLHLLNLCLSPVRRQEQLHRLLGPELLGNRSLTCPALVLGDFADRWSLVADMKLLPSLRRVRRLWWRGTFPAGFPLLARDRAYVKGSLKVVDARILRHGEARRVSGHLPLVLTVRVLDPRSYLKLEKKLANGRMEIAPG